MAKAKKSVSETPDKATTVAAPEVVQQAPVPATAPVVAPIATPVAAPIAAVAPTLTTVTATTSTPPAAASVVYVQKSSGSGCFKWFVCCFVVLLLCCCCTIGGGYLLMTRTGDIIRAITTSTRNADMTRLEPKDVVNFNVDKWFTDNPGTNLGNNKYELLISEQDILKVLFSGSENSFMLKYIGVDVKPGVMYLQVDIGNLLAEQSANGGTGAAVNGFPVDVKSLEGIYLNISITATSPKTIVIKSIKLGDSGFDISPMMGDSMNSFIAEFAQTVDEVEFRDGFVRLVYDGGIDIVPPTGY